MESAAVKVNAKYRCLTCGKEFASGDDDNLRCPEDGALLTPVAEDSMLNSVFDEKYLLMEILGEGGYGRVYKARHLLLQKIVAVKILLTDIVTEPGGLTRFQTEAKATHKLVHPNIVSVTDYGISPRPYIVMEYVDGVTLDQIIATSGPMEFDTFATLFDQICDGMSLAHSHNLVHRDLKPSNIIVDNNTGTPKILDFGVVKVFGEEKKTATGETVGSPPYMSPEQCMGKELDPRADVYSLGCVMYEALSGVKAFDGQNAIECMYKHFNVSPPLVSEVRQGSLPKGIDYLIARTMADYDDRYKTMELLRTDLRKIASGTMKSRLPRVRRVTYRKTISILAEISTIGNWTLIALAIFVYFLLYVVR